MNSFLRQTAQSIIDSIAWERLNRTVLVLPSHRAGLVLKDELLRLQQERKAQVVWAPHVQTLPQLLDDLSPLYPEDELMTIVRLYKHYKRLSENAGQEAMTLDKFYGWGRQMIADFTNIDVSMSAEEVPNFFDNTIAAHELSEWRLEPEVLERLQTLMAGNERKETPTDSIRRQYEWLWKQQLYDLYKALRKEMEAEQKGYNGMRQRAVIEHWEDEETQQKIADKTFLFVGFNYLLPLEREVMQRLKEAGKAHFYWDYVADFQTNEKAFSFTRLNAGILGEDSSPIVSLSEKKPVTVVSCVSREAQAQYVHRWLQDNYTARGQKVGIVICDETMLEPVIYTLSAITLPGESNPEPINITKGFPLRNTQVYARVMTWLNDNQNGKGEDLVTPDFIGRLEAEVLNIKPDSASMETEDSTLSWQELLILESEYQVRKVINQMRLLATNGLGDIPFTLKLLRLLIRRTIEGITMPFHGEPVTDVQVMGVLETRLLDFDKLLLLNVEEGILPQRQTDISFIPFYLRKAYHMQTADERATVYAYNFFRLLCRAGHSTLLFANAETADGGKGMSRFIMQILTSPEFDVTKKRLEEKSTLTCSDTASMDTNESLLSILSVRSDGVIMRGGGKRFSLSPSALNTFISCRRSFYLQYVLGLKPKEDETVLFASNTLGSFVHHAMEFMYRTYLHCDNRMAVPVTPDDIEAIRTDDTRLQEALDAAYTVMNAEWAEVHPDAPQPHYISAHHAAENIIIKGYLSNILERDAQDAQKGLQIYLLEQARFFPLQMEGVGEILMGGTIDRLDIIGQEGNQSLRVVDYKSGSYNNKTHDTKMSATWDELLSSADKGYVRQTLMYSQAVMYADKTGLPIEPNLFFCQKRPTEEVLTTIDIDGNTVHDFRVLQPTFTKTLQSVAKELLTTNDFPQCEENQCPSFCPFFDLCGRKPHKS